MIKVMRKLGNGKIRMVQKGGARCGNRRGGKKQETMRTIEEQEMKREKQSKKGRG